MQSKTKLALSEGIGRFIGFVIFIVIVTYLFMWIFSTNPLYAFITANIAYMAMNTAEIMSNVNKINARSEVSYWEEFNKFLSKNGNDTTKNF